MADIKDTGTGGINIDGDLYSADIGVPDAEGGSQGKWSAGNVSVDKTVKDISKPTRETFAKYLSKSTLAIEGSSPHKNVYPVGSGDQTTFKEAALKDVDGNPTPPAGSSNETNFAQEFSAGIASHGEFPVMKRGIASGDAEDGNKLLPVAAVAADSGGHYIKPSKGLNDNIKEYTKNILDPNLYSPLDDGVLAVPAVVIGDGGETLADNIRPYHLPTSIEVDGGDSSNIFDPSKSITVVTEAKLLGEKTKINVYKVDPVGDSLILFKPLSTSKLSSTQNTDKFADVKIGVSDSYVGIDVNSKGKLKNSIQVGGQTKVLPDGNKLLTTAAVPAPADPNAAYIKPAKELSDPIKSYVSSVLTKNRFNPLGENNPLYGINSFLGREYLENHSIDKDKLMGSAAFNGPNELRLGTSQTSLKRSYDFSRLAHIGTILQVKAAYERGSDSPGYNPSSGASQIQDLLPGIGQLGAGVPLPIELLNVEDIIKNLTTEPITADQLVDFGSHFEGTINTVFEKFSGFTSFGMIALAATLVAAVFVALEVVGLLFNFGTQMTGNIGSLGDEGDKLGSGRHGVGSFLGGPTGISNSNIAADLLSLFVPVGSGGGGSVAGRIMRFFNIYPTRRPLMKCVASGIKSFFGLDAEGSPLGGIANPGALVIVARSIVRSASQIVLAFKDLVHQFSSIGGLSKVEQSIEIFYAIKNSRFIASLNIFAQLGDNKGIIYDPENPAANGEIAYDVTINGLDAGRKISTIDAMEDNGPTRYSKSRLFKGTSRRLAWASSQVPSMLAVPTPVADLQKSMGELLGRKSIWAATPTGLTRMTRADLKPGESRISPDKVKDLENDLDGEYVPFYFHDLRTNEVLGFHAFLMSLNDDYSVNYESSEGFGRVDPIKIYKSTNRKIGLSFMVAATDAQDFDDMWAKINKLLTMAYPQYTQGKSISVNENYQFVKPFTQLIGASPMIRLRVGNLFASNYSRFNLAGIFGLANGTAGESAILKGKTYYGNAAEESMEVEGARQTAYDLSIKDYQRKSDATAIAVDAGRYAPDSKWIMNPGRYSVGNLPPLTDPNVYNLVAVILSAVPAAGGANPSYTIKFEQALVGDTKKDTLAKQLLTQHINQRVIPNINNATFNVSINDFRDLTPKYKKDYETKRADAETNDEAAARANREAEAAAIAAGQRAATKAQKEYQSSNPPGASAAKTGYFEEVTKFLDPKNNVIVRSFESAGGKGLAGFIDSINFDWFTGVTWDAEAGRKAPKMCKVTIAFTPIHDISPGLDAAGYNRAPVYPLGT